MSKRAKKPTPILPSGLTHSQFGPRPRRDGNVTKNDQHGAFIVGLGQRLLTRYTDGGPGTEPKPRIKRRAYGDPAGRLPKRGQIGSGGRFARSTRRRAAR